MQRSHDAWIKWCRGIEINISEHCNKLLPLSLQLFYHLTTSESALLYTEHRDKTSSTYKLLYYNSLKKFMNFSQFTNRGFKSFNQYPSRPLTPQQRKTCRLTLPTGTLAEGCHTYTQYIVYWHNMHVQYTCLDSWRKTIKSMHTHECVQHSPTQSYSVLV